MKRISNTMLRIGMILSIIAGATLIFVTPFLIVTGVSTRIHEMIVEAVTNGDVHSDYDPEVAATVIQSMLLTYGIITLIFGAICIAAAIVDSKALKEGSTGRYIACIILGSMSTGFAIAGGILGLIADARIRRNQARETSIE